MDTATPVFHPNLAVRRAIDGCLAQDCSSFEGSMVDDGRGDGTGEVVASSSNPRVRPVRYPIDRDVRPARKSAVRTSRGEWLNLLGSDYEMLSGRISQTVGYRPFGRSGEVQASRRGLRFASSPGLHMARLCGFAPRRFQAVMCNAAFARLLGGDRDGAIQNATLAVVLAGSRAAMLIPGSRLRRHWRAAGIAVPAVPAALSQRPDKR